MRVIKKLFLHSRKHYIISISISIAFIFAYVALRNFNLFFIPDALKTSGILTALIGLLILTIFYGAFDTFIYAFKVARKGKNREYKDLVEYTDYKRSERKRKELYYMPYISIGLLVLIAGFIVGFFIPSKDKLETPNVLVNIVEDEVTLTWENDSNATNGYNIRCYKWYFKGYDENNKEIYEKVVIKEESIPASTQDTVTYKIIVTGLKEEPSDTKNTYHFEVNAESTDKYNGSDYFVYTYPNT